MTKRKANFLLPAMCLLVSLMFPERCAEGVRKGLEIAVKSAFPALFPALVLSGMISSSLPKKSGKGAFLTPFILGLFCGFPVGAKAVCDLYQKGNLSRKDAEHLLVFCNNAGPAFLISFCGAGLFADEKKGAFLFLAQSLLSGLCLLFFFGKRLFEKMNGSPSSEDTPPLAAVLPGALSSAAKAFLYIASCVIFFSFFTELALSLLPASPLSGAVFSLFCELSGGVARLSSLPSSVAFPLCALGCGWGGVSVHLQSCGLMAEVSLSPKPYFFGKTFFALSLFLAALFFQKLL